MALQVIQGPPNSGRAGAVLARFADGIERDPVLVVPTGGDVAAFERELCPDGTALVGGSITTFGSLFGEVARALVVELGPPLTAPQRQALVRAAVRRVEPRRLRRSAARPGFGPALDALIGELQAALISPADFAAEVERLEDPGHERELAAMYAAYVELRDASGQADDGLRAERAIAALRAEPEAWGERPVLIYGFDDLTRAQVELVDALARAAEVTVAVSYDDRRALSPRARLLGRLREELGAELALELGADEAYSSSAALRHLDRHLFEHGAEPVESDGSLVLLESAGVRGEAEAIGIEVARLLAAGCDPDEVAVVVRHPDSTGPLLAAVLSELGLPVALEASTPLAATCVGGSLVALCRAARDESAVEDLLAHLRADPSLPPAAVDRVELRIRRGEAQTIDAATATWQHPPRHIVRLREAGDGPAALRALARSARELAEGAHRGRAPLAAGRSADEGEDETPFSALELRAGVVAAELLDELATVADLPGCEPPRIADAIDAIESATVPRWRGPATGRVRIISPYAARAARVRALFCASLGDGEFPSAAPPDPLLSEERRRELGNPDLRRSEPADEERYLFHACVSRPTERLYLSWQSCDEDGAALGRSPFVDEVLDLIAPDPETAAEDLIRARGPERSVLSPGEATTERGLARAIAGAGWDADRAAELASWGVDAESAAATLALFEGLPDPRALPGPLRSPRILGELGGRRVFSAGSLEGWLECPYRWFVDHELAPLRLEPEADPLWLGGVVHTALERLYREAPGDDAIPRPGDLGRWRQRFGELLAEIATARAGAPLNSARRAALARARLQVESFLAAEAESETELRPRHLELAFGPMDDDGGDGEPELPPLPIGEIELRGRIDRIDVAADGHSAVVRDYKTGKTVARAAEFDGRGTLQIQLYMRAAGSLLDLDPVAGLYQPLGAARPADRRPRGIARRDDPCLDGLDLVGPDKVAAEDVEAALAAAEQRAAAAAGEVRAGRIGRRPIGGSCPEYCTYQSICRLERAIGAVGEESANGGEE